MVRRCPLEKASFHVPSCWPSLYSGIQQCYSAGRDVRGTRLSFPNQFVFTIKMSESRSNSDPYVFVKAELNLVDTDGQSNNLAAIPEAQIHAALSPVHGGTSKRAWSVVFALVHR